MILVDTYIKIIRKKAWSFNRTTGIDFEELFSEGCVAYCDAIRTYDKSKKTKKTTWIYTCVQNHLINFCKREQKHTFQKEDIENYPNLLVQYPDYFFEVLDRMTTNGKSVAAIILEDKIEYAKLPSKLARGKISRELRQRGWKHQDIWNVLHELKSVFN
jgi:DNA-directed RNA polymerase specialized sigma subunit